jgi:hypothetical protein
MAFGGNNNELKNNELFDLKEKGYFEDGTTAGKLVLSAFGQEQFSRLVKTLPAKDQVLIEMTLDNTEKSEAEIKDFMQQ